MWWLGALAVAGSYEDGVAALKAGRPAQAAEHLARAVEAEPERADAWWELGWSRWAGDDWAGAVQAWEQVERIEPGRDELAHWLGAARARVALAAVDTQPASVPTEAAGARLTFAAVGDTMMGSDLRKGAAGLPSDDGRSIFAAVQPTLAAADVAFLNLEGPLADGLPSTKCGPSSTSCYAFRTPTRFAGALAWAGFDVASLANNHAMDLGVAGQEATMRALEAVGIAHAGRYGDVATLERNGLRIAVVAAHSGSCCLNVNRPEEVAAAIRAADAEADLVVLSFHGGAEGAKARHVPGRVEVAWGEQRGDVRALARAAVDAGADLVFGHGPHVLRGIEVYRGRLIAYSLGNFTGYRQFGTQGGLGGTSAIVEATVAANGVLVAARVHPLRLDGQSVPAPDPTGAALDQIRELSAADFPETGVRIEPDGTIRW